MGGLMAAVLVLGLSQVVTPEIAMPDQFEARQEVKQYRGDVVVLIYGDRKSADVNKSLGEQIHVAFHPTAKGLTPAEARKTPVRGIPDAPAGAKIPNVHAIPVACVGKVPPLVQKIVRNQIKKGSPEVPVWLDFDDTMKGQFQLKPGVPNVVVLDAQGRYRYAAAGAPTQDGTTKLLDVIEALRREAVQGK